MAQIDLGKIRPVWQGLWTANTAYEQHDMVKQGVNSYICTTAHTSGSSFSTTNWDDLAQGADIPAQSGNSGNYLTTDGSAMSWSTLPPSDDASALTTGTLAEARQPSGYFKHLYESSTQTESDRSVGGSWTDHLTLASFTIPSGWKGHVIVSGHMHGGYESGAGGAMHRMRLTGSATYTSTQVKAAQGRFDNFSEPHNSTYCFEDVSAGTYTPALQLATYQGSYIANYHMGVDFFMCTAFIEKI